MEQPWVSVIIPTFNRHAMVSELVESLSRQTYRRLHIILVNDAGEPLEFIRELYPELHIQLLNVEQNKQHVHARNCGLELVRDDYIMLCDDDDLLLPTHVERMMEAIREADLVYSDVEIFDYKLEGATRRATKRFVFSYDSDYAAMRRFSTFVASGCLFRTKLLEKLECFDTEMHHYWDWDFYLRAAAHYRVKRVPAASALYAFAEQGDNMSGSHESMRPYLDRLSAKHGLGELPTKNFFVLLEEPEVQKRRAQTEVLWDGEPIVSRYAAAVAKDGERL